MTFFEFFYAKNLPSINLCKTITFPPTHLDLYIIVPILSWLLLCRCGRFNLLHFARLALQKCSNIRLQFRLFFCQAPRRARWMLWPLERDRSWVRKWASRFAIACSRLHVRDFFFKFSMTFFWKNGNFHLIIADQKLWNGKIIFTALTAPPLVLFLHFFPIFFFNFLFFRRFFRFLPWFFPF